jgi:hypothetical protein
MRTIVLVILAGLGSTASACPVEGPCVRAAMPQVHPSLVVAHGVRGLPSVARTTAASGEVEMPWIWQVLKHKVVRHMPRYEQRSFAMHLAPVVVSTVDTVPGVGVEGRF